MKWQLLSSKSVYDNFMHIENRVYKLPNGVTKNFDIKVGTSGVCILALTTDNKILISEQYRPGPDKTLQELPGGVIDKTDKDPETAAARELLEETGYSGNLALVTEYYTDAYNSNHRYAFVATECKPVGMQHLDTGEVVTVRQVSVPDFIKLVRSGQMTDVNVAYLGLDHLGLL